MKILSFSQYAFTAPDEVGFSPLKFTLEQNVVKSLRCHKMPQIVPQITTLATPPEHANVSVLTHPRVES